MLDGVGIEQLDADVEIRLVLLDRQRPDQRLGIAPGHILDLLISQDHRPRGVSGADPVQHLGIYLATDEINATRLAFGRHGVGRQVGQHDDIHVEAVGEDVADQIMARLVPATDQDVSTRLHGFDPPVFLAPVLDDEGGQRRREAAEDTDAQNHKSGAHHLSRCRHRVVVPVADGRRRHDCPPKTVSEGMTLEKGEQHTPDDDERGRQYGDPCQRMRSPMVSCGSALLRCIPQCIIQVSKRMRFALLIIALFVAQFLAYKDLRDRSSADLATLQSEKDAVEAREHQLEVEVSGLESTTREKDKRIKERGEQIEELRALLDQARAASTGGPPTTIGKLTYIPEAISTGRQDLPYGVQVTVQTSASIQPIRLRISFSGEVGDCDVYLAGTGGDIQTIHKLFSRNICTVSLGTPAFTPSRGLVVTVLSKKPINFDSAERLN